MRRGLVFATVMALAVARPELYKEKEDFQYSRSSTDEGSKSGFYGAQRGNMGGNYERAHNMDLLAQHQMGGLVKTVQGELGDGANQRSGSVFTAANTRGIYGSGHYDLSNLEGRNFQEGTTLGNAQSHSSLSSSHNAGYGSHSQTYVSGANSGYGSNSHSSRYGYHKSSNADQALYGNNQQSVDNLQSASQYDGTQEAHSTGYQSQSGYQGQSVYDQSAANSAYGSNYRLVSGSPVRVIVRPGGPVVVPFAAQQTYDGSQRSTTSFDQNAINSEAEVLGSNDQQSSYKPSNTAKHYESSYSYRKQWEKHDTKPIDGVPVAIPTVNPYPTNSELYEDVNVQGSEHQHQAQNAHSSSQYRGYNVKSGVSTSQSRQQSAYNAQAHVAASDSASASNVAGSSAYTHGAYNHGAGSSLSNLQASNLNSQVEDISSKPKSYHSSYSYHKSWERQGDPYVIQPSTNGLYTNVDSQASQRLTAASQTQGASVYGSHHYGSRLRQGQVMSYSNNGIDCDENGHIRVARSYRLHPDQVPEYNGQQSQNLVDFSQQSQNLEQQSQNLENFGQESQNLDFGQESQNLGQLSQNLEDFGQQSQNLENFGQESQNLDFGQQSQNLENFGQESQNMGQLSQNLDFGQQLQNLGQQSQKLEDFGQQSQDLGQQTQNLEEFGQHSQNLESFGQQSQNLDDFGQQSQNQWDQQSQTGLGQQTQNTWSTLETIQNNNSDHERHVNVIEHNGFNHQGVFIDPQTQEIIIQPRPPLNQAHLSETQEVFKLPTPTKTTILNSDKHDQENEQAQEGLQHYFSQSESTSFNAPGHTNTQMFWNVNPGSPTALNPNWQQYLNLNTGYGYNQHNFFSENRENTGYNVNPWAFEQTFSNKPTSTGSNIGSNGQTTFYTNTQTHINHNDRSTYSTSNVHINPSEFGSTGLTNLWDMIDNIEKQANEQDGVHSNQEKQESTKFDSSLELMQNDNKDHLSFANKTIVTEVHAPAFVPSTSTVQPKLESTTIKQNNLQTDDVERGDIEPEKMQPEEEAGRGDIGPDDTSKDNSNISYKPLEIFENKPKNPKLKTTEEIETLSLTKETKNRTTFVNTQSIDEVNQSKHDQSNDQNLSVLGLSEKPLHHLEQDNWKLQSDILRTTSTTPKSSYRYVHPNIYVEQESHNVEQHNTDQQFENSGQQSVENINQQDHTKHESFPEQSVHQIVDFGQQSEDEHLDHKFENFNQQNINQQTPSLGHQVENIDQRENKKYESFPEQSEHQIVDFGQQSEHLGQEHLNQQFENFNQQNIEQHGSNIEQGLDEVQQHLLNEFETLGQQNVNLSQESFSQFKDFGQQSENFNQQNIEKHGSNIEQGPDEMQQQNLLNLFETLGQQNVNLNQESFNQFEDFGQQSENLGQQTQQFDNVGQQSEGFQQENIHDFGQHEQFEQESLSQFGQSQERKSHLEKEQQLENWGQQSENLDQQNQSEGLSKPEENIQQQSKQIEIITPLSVSNKEGRELHANEPIVEPEIVTKKVTKIDTQPETVTEKVGFWGTVGSKFVSAKDKVKSWFSSG